MFIQQLLIWHYADWIDYGDIKGNERIGIFSYGSGCSSRIFTVVHLQSALENNWLNENWRTSEY